MSRLAVLMMITALPACLFEEDDGWDGTSNPPPSTQPPGNPKPPTDPVGPCGERTCSPKTPNGLDFVGTKPVVGGFPNGSISPPNNHIAIGGTHEVTLQLGNTQDLFALPFEAKPVDDSILAVEAVDGAHLTLRGLGGTTNLRVTDPQTNELYDRYAYASSEFALARPVALEEWITCTNFLGGSAKAFAFAPGQRRVGIAYMNSEPAPNRLIDTTATIAGDGVTQVTWDTVALDASTGHEDLAIRVGGHDATVGVDVTATADSIATLLALDNYACFGAFTANEQFISGITWTFTVNGTTVPGNAFLGPNCVANPANDGVFTVTASAGGRSITTTTLPGGSN